MGLATCLQTKHCYEVFHFNGKCTLKLHWLKFLGFIDLLDLISYMSRLGFVRSQSSFLCDIPYWAGAWDKMPAWHYTVSFFFFWSSRRIGWGMLGAVLWFSKTTYSEFWLCSFPEVCVIQVLGCKQMVQKTSVPINFLCDSVHLLFLLPSYVLLPIFSILALDSWHRKSYAAMYLLSWAFWLDWVDTSDIF